MSSTRDMQLLIAVFPTEEGANRGLDKLRAVAATGILDITETAVLSRDPATGAVRLIEEASPAYARSDQQRAKTMAGVVFPSSVLLSDLIGSFLGIALGANPDRRRQRDGLIRAGRRLRAGTSALAVLVKEHLITRLKAGQQARYALLDCTSEAEEVAAFEIRIKE